MAINIDKIVIMVETIIYTTGILFIALVMAYLQINKNELFKKIFVRIPLNRLPAGTNKHLRNHMVSFKKGASLKGLLVWLLLALLFAFIIYNYIFFTVPVSNSMRPTFEKGDLVLMQKVDLEPHEGDIIMFGMAVVGGLDQPITHRIHSTTSKGIQTKGDATPIDNWVLPPERIYAKAVTIGGNPIVIKHVGYYFLDTQISSAYAREFGIMQTIVAQSKQLGLLIFVICIVAYIWLSVEDIKKQKKYRR